MFLKQTYKTQHTSYFKEHVNLSRKDEIISTISKRKVTMTIMLPLDDVPLFKIEQASFNCKALVVFQYCSTSIRQETKYE